MWLKNIWYVAGFAGDVGENLVARRFLGQHVLLYRTDAGKAVAMEDRCPHRLVPLSLGRRVDGEAIECGYHGMRFNAAGRCTFAPGQAAPGAVRVRIFPLAERHRLLWIWLGAPDLADESMIPDMHWFDDPAWTVVEGYSHFDAGYRLITDNLLDLSHEAYVHQKTIGNGALAEADVDVSIDGNQAVRAYREMHDIPPPPFFAKFMNYSGRIDRGQLAFYMPPGIHMTEYFGRRVEGDGTKFLNRVMHLVTPETERTSHYFWAQTRNYRLDDAELSRSIREATLRTFDEDRDMLRHQQERLIEEGATVPAAAIRFDAAPVQAQRILARLIEEEEKDPTFVFSPAKIAD